jgi:hypothetical protein
MITDGHLTVFEAVQWCAAAIVSARRPGYASWLTRVASCASGSSELTNLQR